MAGSLFQGSPQTATSYTTSNTETPKWLQDAIYNQIQMATNVANTPYQDYMGDRVAELSPLQQKAYQQVIDNQGAWKDQMGTVASGLQNIASGPGGAAAAKQYLDSAAGMSGVTAAQPGMQNQSNLLSNINYNAASQALTPYVNQATSMSGVTAAQPYINTASSNINSAGAVDTATGLKAEQQAYLQPKRVEANLDAGQLAYNQASQAAGNIAGSAQPMLSAAAQAAGNITGAASPYINKSSQLADQSAAGSSLTSANPYLQAAAQKATTGIADYMNPYQQNAMDVIAKQGARNLSENLLPGVSDAFIKAGQFGGTRMGEFGSRALRDTQEAILNQQATMANQGYGQAVNASAADLARQAQIGSTAGQLSSTDLARQLSAAGQQGQLAQTAGGLTAQQASNLNTIGQTTGGLNAQQASALSSIGQGQTTAGQAQQNFGLTAAQQVQQAQTSDAARMLQAGQASGQLGQTMGSLTQGQQSTMLNAGQAMSGAQNQAISSALQGASQYGQQGQNLGALTQGQQSALANIASQTGSLTNADLSRQQGALTALANTTQQQNAMRSGDVASLEAAGQGQQIQQQKQLDAAYAQAMEPVNYPKQQLDWLNTQVRGMAPIVPTSTTQSGQTTGATYSASPLSQVASGMAMYKAIA